MHTWIAHSGYVATGAAITGLGCFLFWRRQYSVSSVTVSIPFGMGSISLHPSSCEREVAWKLYVELRTRKAALPFDDDHDTIVEVYDSLYQLFPVMRALLSTIPAHQLGRCGRLADLILRVQGDGIRPHLTRWQAGFRRWWDIAVAEPGNSGRPPQEIQRAYPAYSELVADLKDTNTALSQFAGELFAIANPPKRAFWPLWQRRRIRPEAPTVKAVREVTGV